MSRIGWFTLFVITAVVVAAAVAAGQIQAQLGEPSKQLPDPWAGLSDAQRAEIVAAAHARNDEYLQNFIRTGQDPRSLPRLEVPAYAASPPSLRDAVAESTLIGTGRVMSVNFAPNPSGGMPLATSSVALDRVVKGEPVPTLTIVQLGGPVAQETGGALAQLNNDELLLPGDDVVLFLGRDSLGEWRPLPGAGIIFIESGLAVPEASNAFGTSLKGQTKAAVVAVISDLARGQSALP